MTRSVCGGPGLLVSVRSPEEAHAALAGGADIIDVKEPDHGSLGRAADQTIAAVLDCVAGRRPVSAALGEVVDRLGPCRDPRLAYVKWGLAGCGLSGRWQTMLDSELSQPGDPQTVIVAYADWQCAQAPAVTEVVAFACQKPGNVLLIDTYCKDPDTRTKDRRPTLLDWLTLVEIADICAKCHAAGGRVALAGSLGLTEIAHLQSAGPDWFAVRGAACAEDQRRRAIDVDKVRGLVKLLVS